MPAFSSSLMTVVDDNDDDSMLGELGEIPAAPAGLWECLQKVADPRKRRGVRHPITGIIALALAATLAGAQSFEAIGERVADAGDTAHPKTPAQTPRHPTLPGPCTLLGRTPYRIQIRKREAWSVAKMRPSRVDAEGRDLQAQHWAC